ncbi:hypothetical protein FHS22_007016 [Planomonospora venezuelensis]|uniref:Uncharacterized protein n=1 Tax=Planomonospora venezuelensis TaxID=1999 RepID=A0A841DG56_PLAVE|nr:hypothetical protein [Planomonospora venezuelensis]
MKGEVRENEKAGTMHIHQIECLPAVEVTAGRSVGTVRRKNR